MWINQLNGAQGWLLYQTKNGKICICMVLKHHNKSVLPEVYPLPTVDKTLAQLSEIKAFQNLTPTVGFGKSHWTNHPTFSQPLSPYLVSATSTSWYFKCYEAFPKENVSDSEWSTNYYLSNG